MKKRVNKLLLSVLFILFFMVGHAQYLTCFANAFTFVANQKDPPEPGFPPPPPGNPVDGGVLLLLVAGAAFGASKLRKKG